MNPGALARLLALAISLLASAASGSAAGSGAAPRVYVVGVAGAG